MRSKNIFRTIITWSLITSFGCSNPGSAPESISISIEQASGLAAPALHCIQKPYPYKPGNVLVDDSSLMPPRLQHPAFYGCFDWHSSVHGHWTLVKLLKEYPDLPEGDEIRSKLSENLSAENISIETDFFYSEGNKTFERTYGWAWLLKLALSTYNSSREPFSTIATRHSSLSATLISISFAIKSSSQRPVSDFWYRSSVVLLPFYIISPDWSGNPIRFQQ